MCFLQFGNIIKNQKSLKFLKMLINISGVPGPYISILLYLGKINYFINKEKQY